MLSSRKCLLQGTIKGKSTDEFDAEGAAEVLRNAFRGLGVFFIARCSPNAHVCRDRREDDYRYFGVAYKLSTSEHQKEV